MIISFTQKVLSVTFVSIRELIHISVLFLFCKFSKAKKYWYILRIYLLLNLLPENKARQLFARMQAMKNAIENERKEKEGGNV